MLNEKKFDQEVKELEQTKKVDLDDLLILKKIAEGEKVEIDSAFLANKIIKDIFQNGYNNEILIPWNFFDTEIGKAILLAKYKISTNIYFVADLVELTGKSRQFISKEVKNGNIVSNKGGGGSKQNGIVYFTEDEVNKYLKKKGYPTIEEKKEVIYKTQKERIINAGYEREEKYE